MGGGGWGLIVETFNQVNSSLQDSPFRHKTNGIKLNKAMSSPAPQSMNNELAPLPNPRCSGCYCSEMEPDSPPTIFSRVYASPNPLSRLFPTCPNFSPITFYGFIRRQSYPSTSPYSRRKDVVFPCSLYRISKLDPIILPLRAPSAHPAACSGK